MTPQQQKQHGLWYHLLDVLFNIVVIVAIVTGIRTFLVAPFQVEGNSMIATLEDKQYIIINKLRYLIGDPERGDVVVFNPPAEVPEDHKKYYVKRIIGVPGDEVILAGGEVYVKPVGSEKEEKLPEEYLNEQNSGKTFAHPPSSGNTERTVYKVPTGKYFVLGDNRQGSLDSRSFGIDVGEPDPFVPEGDIKGRVWFVALPITKIHALEPPEYGL